MDGTVPLNILNFLIFNVGKEIRKHLVFCVPGVLHTLCSIMSNFIILKELIIERGEVQRRSKKAINTYKKTAEFLCHTVRDVVAGEADDENQHDDLMLSDVHQIFLLRLTLTDINH